MKKLKYIAVSLLLFVSYSISAQCPTGTSGDPFTSLGQARSVTTAGIYHFSLLNVTFSTYVDANGYVMVAHDYGNGSGNLPQGTSLTNTARGILSPTVLFRLGDANEARISHSGGDLDVTTTNSSIIGKIVSNVTIHRGAQDNAVNNDWTGTEATALTVNAGCASPQGSSLHQNIAHICGTGTGIHWIPSGSYQRIRWDQGAHAGEIGNSESLTLWVRADFHSTCHTYVPDDNFENYLETHDADRNVVPVGDPTSMGNGIANDNYVLNDRIDDVTLFALVNQNGIADLTGIEAFTSLETFVISGGNNTLTSVDLSNSSNLSVIFISTPTLSSIDVSGLTSLSSINLENTNIGSLDVTTNTALTYIGLIGSPIGSLNTSNNTALRTLVLSSTINITSLDLRNNSSLTSLNVDNSSSIETIDIRNGNNTAIISGLHAENTPNLTCVQVDDVAFARTNWTDITDPFVFSQVGCGETYVPDDNFEAFLEANGMGNGIANDNAVTTSNITGRTTLTIAAQNISDLTGIEDFTALKFLNANNNNITTVDLSKNTDLQTLLIASNPLSTIDVSSLTDLQTLGVGSTSLSSIDVSNNPDLLTLWAYSTNLTAIDVSNNLSLQVLHVANTNVSTLDVSANTGLLNLDISTTPIASLDLSTNVDITNLDVENADNLTTLDLTNNPDLTYMTLSNTDNLETVDFRNGNNGNIITFFAENVPKLSYVNVDNASFSVANWTNVSSPTIFQEHGGETYVPDDNFEAFLEANGMGNGFANDDHVTTTNISGVTTLDIDNESISDMTGIEGFTALTSLSANGNTFTSIDLSANTALTFVDLRDNSIPSVNTSTLNLLETLLISGTHTITSIDISNNPALRTLQVTSNQLTSLDLSNNTALQSLTVRFTSITSLDLSNNTALTYLDIQDVSIPTMDLSNNSALTQLFAKNGALASLNVKNGNNTNMTTFSIHTNPNLQCVAVDDVVYANTNFTNIDAGLTFNNVNCDTTTVPDDNFENYLETHDANGNVVSVGASNSMGNGVANDNLVYTYRISPVTALNVNYQSIADMTGLADFTALEDLDAIGNSFSSIDVSANTALKDLELRQNGSLTGVDVSNLPLLESLNVNETNSITSVDVSNNPALKTLQVTSGQVTSVDVSNNPALEILTVEKTSITSLDLTNNPLLTFLDARDLSVATLDLSNNPLLVNAFLQRGDWTSVNLKSGGNANLTGLAIHTSPNLYCIQVDDVTYANTNFTNKDAQAFFSETCGTTTVPDDNFENYLETHDASGNVVSLGAANSMGNGVANDNLVFTDKISSVTTLDISSQSITDITGITSFAALENLNVSTNNISAVDVSQLSALEELYVVNTTITTLDVSSNTALRHLEVSGTNLTTLDLSNNPNMQVLYLVNMPQLFTVDLKNGNGTNMTTFNRTLTGSITCVNVDESALNYFNTTFVDENTNPVAPFNAHCFETYVPGDNFENYLETHDANGNVVPLGDPTSMGNGIANDDYVTTANIASVTNLYMQTQSINDLRGIEGFASLTYFEVRGNNLFTSIDLSNNTTLEEVHIGSSPYNTIDVSTLTNLRVLDIEDTQLTTLDVSNNTALTTFKLRNSDITNLDFSNNTALTSLEISNSDLTTLNVKNGNNTNVTLFDTTGSTNLACILVDTETYSNTNWTNIESGSVFTEVSCGTTNVPDDNFEAFLEANGMGNGIANDDKVFTHKIASVTTLDIDNQNISDMTGIEAFIALDVFSAFGNPFTSIDVSSNTAITHLDLRNTSITTVDVSALTLLEGLFISGTNTLTSLDVSNNTALKNLQFTSNQVTSLDLSNNTALESLNIRFTGITSLDLSNNTALTHLDIQDMSIPTVDLSNNTALTSLYTTRNSALTSLNVKNGNNTNMTAFNTLTNPNLKCVLVDNVTYANTNFTNIDAGLIFNNVSCNMTLVPDDNFEAYLEANSLGNGVANDDLVFTHNISSVVAMDLDNQSITDLTGLEDFTALEALNARNNGLTTIDVSANTNLTHLFLDNNSLTTINISTLTALEEIGLTGNTGITSLNVGPFASLENVEIRNTGITSLDVTSNTQLISLDIRETGITTLDLSQNTNLTTFRANDSSLSSLDIRNGQNTNITTFDTTGTTSLTCVNVDDANYSTTNWINIASGTRFAPDCSYIYMPDDNFEMYAETHDSTGRSVPMGDPSSLGNGVMDNYVVPTKTTFVSNLNISGENISDLTGLEGFDFVTNLNVSNNNITSLDLTGINTVSILQASNNPLTTINIGSSFLLILDISDTNLTSINLSNQFSLNNIDANNAPLTALDVSAVTGLTDLDISNTNLTSLDVSSNTSLRDLNISGSSNLATLNLGPSLNLRILNISQTSIASLSLAGNLNLDVLNISNTSITSLDLSSNTGLRTFTAQNSALTALNFKNGNNTNITTFNTTGSTSLACIEVDNPVYSSTNWTNVDSGTSFSDVGCGTTSIPDANFETFLESNLLGNGIPNDNLVFTGNISVIPSLDISNQNISDLTGIAAFTSLQTLNAESNNLSTVDLSSNTTLTSLDLGGNLSITTINLSALTALQTLDIANTGISNLDISNNTALTTLDVEGTSIASLSLIPHTSLVSFNAKDAALTSLNIKNGNNSNVTLFDVTGNTGLSCITVDNAGYSVTNWTNIDSGMSFSETTSCATTSITDANFEAFLEANGMGNGIANDNLVITGNIAGVTSLDISSQNISDLTGIEDFTALEILNAGSNPITSVDFTSNTALKELNLEYTDITLLDVSYLTALENLDAKGTDISTIDLSQNIALTSINLGAANNITILDLSKNVNLTTVGLSFMDSLDAVDLKNGTNTNITIFAATSTAACFKVDDPAYSDANWTQVINPGERFSLTCSGIDTQVPDDNFENYLETHDANGNVVPVGDATSMGNGIANDDYVLTSRISGVTVLNMQNQSITDMTGIEDFTSLQELRLDGNTGINTIDVSANTNLVVLRLYQTNVSTLDVSALSNLGDLVIASTQITSIDVSNNTALYALDMRSTNIPTVDLSQNTALTYLNALNANLTSLNVRNGNNTNVTTFELTGNTGLSCVFVDNPSYSFTNWTDVESGVVFATTDCNMTYVPDDNFEAHLEANGMGNGVANDNYVLTANISSVTALSMLGDNISDMTGIEDFAALITLNINNNNVSSIDVSSLTSLEVLVVANNPMGSIDVSNNTALKQLGISNTNINSLDISANTALENLTMVNVGITSLDLSSFSALSYLNISNTSISSLDLSNNSALTVLNAINSGLTSLNVKNGNNTSITTFQLTGNPGLSCITVDDAGYSTTNWTSIDAGVGFSESVSCGTTSIPDNNFEAFLEANGMGNGIADDNLVFTGNISEVTTLDISGQSIANLTGIGVFVALENLSVANNSLTSIDVSSNTSLQVLNVSQNGITSIDVSALTALTSLDVSQMSLSGLNVSNNTGLTILNVSSNASLSSLTITALTVLENLNISSTGISTIDLSNNTALINLNIANTGISSLDLTNHTALTDFNAQNAALTTLDIKNGANTNITSFNTTGNAGLTCIQVDNAAYSTTNWTNIDGTTSFSFLCGGTYVPDNNFEMYLETHDDRGRSVSMGDAESLGNGVMDDYVLTSKIETITSLFVSNENISDLTGIADFTALRSLWVDENSLTSLDVSNNTNLDDLNCSSNSLTSIDVSDLTNLASLDVSNMNGITTIDLSNNTDLLSLRASNTGLTSLDLRVFTSLNDLDVRNAQLTSLDLRNGNNTNMNTVRFDGNFDLTCVSVDDVDYATNNWDPIAGEYSLSCGETYVPDDAFEMYLETHDDRGFSVSMGSPSSLGNGSMDNFVTTSKLEFIFNLDLSNESIADLTGIQDFENLSQLNVSFTNITSLDLSGLQFITHLYLSNTSLTSLDVSSYNNLQVLDISDTSISSINLSSNSFLQEINIGNTPMTSINLSNNTGLTRFEMFNGALTSLDLSSNTSLTDFSISNSASLTTVDLRNGNNTNMVGFFSNSNVGLTCIQVDDAAYSTTNWTSKDAHTSFGEDGCGVMLTAKVFLHGAYDSSSSMMRADLGAARLPTATPHSDGVAANSAIFDVTGTNAIVDWVYVELRDKDDITSVIAGASAFVQRDGDVVATDGTSALTIDVASGDYYISIKHRNHIPIATDMAISLSGTVTHIDFTNVNNIRGGASAISDVNGTPVLIPGDVDGNGQVQLSDYFAGLALVGQPGYRTGDINMDGQVQLSDMLNILVSFIGKGIKF